MAKLHYLKIWPQFFKDAKSGVKQFEVRKNDREYEVGDTLILEEFDQEAGRHTGAWVPKEIIYMLDDTRFLKEGYVILGLKDIKF